MSRSEMRLQAAAAATTDAAWASTEPAVGLLDAILRSSAAAGASDTHFSADGPALQRLDGSLAPVAGHPGPIPGAVLLDELLAMMGPSHREDYRSTGEVDLSYTVTGVGRFRVNVFRQLGQVAAAFRLIASRAFTLDELGAPTIARELALRPRGLVLVTGPTGSGKSTTLTAMIDIIKRPVAMNSNLHDAIFAPETLDMWFADAGKRTPACDEPYAHCNLADLIALFAKLRASDPRP